MISAVGFTSVIAMSHFLKDTISVSETIKLMKHALGATEWQMFVNSPAKFTTTNVVEIAGYSIVLTSGPTAIIYCEWRNVESKATLKNEYLAYYKFMAVEKTP